MIYTLCIYILQFKKTKTKNTEKQIVPEAMPDKLDKDPCWRPKPFDQGSLELLLTPLCWLYNA